MSRLGKNPIVIPENVDVNLTDQQIIIKGPKGQLSHDLHPSIDLIQENGTIIVKRKSDSKQDCSLHGLYWVKITNMINGTTTGFERLLEIIGVGYRVALKGKDLEFSLGYSHPILFPAIDLIEFELDGQTKLKIKGINKETVGQVAADIRALRPPEPYKGKGIKYSDEVIIRKAGKAGKVGG